MTNSPLMEVMGEVWTTHLFFPFPASSSVWNSSMCMQNPFLPSLTQLSPFKTLGVWGLVGWLNSNYLGYIIVKVIYPKYYKHVVFTLAATIMHYKAKIDSLITFMLINFLVWTLQSTKYIMLYMKKQPSLEKLQIFLFL